MARFIKSMVFFLIILNFQASCQEANVKRQSQTDIKLIVYGSDTCHYCIETKAFLKENNIGFVYFDVDVNLVKQKEMVLKLQKANIPLDAISLPIVDLQGKLIMNNVDDFNGFLKKLISKN